MDKINGTIIKGIGGFYYVEAADTLYECKARGVFRKNKVTPFVGDHVTVSLEKDGTGTIEEILPRKNSLVRPPVANIDQLVIVVSICDPSPSTLVIDKIIAAAEDRGIEPVIVISKSDLKDCQWLNDIYQTTGIPLLTVSSATGEGIEEVEELLKGKISAFTGNSGVGKSSLLNRIDSRFHLQTGEISQKLGRGRHTTRQVAFLKLGENTYVADTPGFSSISVERYDLVKKENLQYCFREFEPYLNQCKFVSCSHTCEKGCAVLKAVEEGAISKSRHESYVAMYNEVKDLKEWNMK
ncbi:ribosome small subunit-dependent GTPase A [Caproiciproducens sp. CPB-2]|uniref:ribosome small subunit-dependent GTPase A n=1 Tax=Caproiciproducens sp. CPB-2 TaxID=3030017 RepID=UPI0023DB1290|nr:ribosome small subunit-dependent GTPase A [Caproiciproducens sp. CPB-2]MDF1495074.1 ribosome small subunit-dependent GTPase A [Caproiciproducens sp. CPB-2]